VTDDSERMIGAILLGNNVVNILSASLATALLTRIFGDSGVAFATLGMTLLVLIFGEVLPKTFAITRPEAMALRGGARHQRPDLPLRAGRRRGAHPRPRASAAVGVQADPGSNILAVREEIVGALSIGHSEGVVEKEDRDRILGALHLSDRTVEEVMLHRSKIEMIDASLPPKQVLEQVLRSPHTRLPIWKDDPENIVGVLHAKDLLRAMHGMMGDGKVEEAELQTIDIMTIAMKPYFVPETTTLDDQMRQFLRRHTHFALVVDEYGSIEGLITLEDILEEIVGEITDEFDISADRPIRKTEGGDYIVDGATTIRDLNRANDWQLPDEEANTVAGLVIHEAQTIPTQGQVFSFHGFRFEVLQRKDNRITRLKIRPL
jgi:Mg2+/Co2+ transporter CorB